MTPEERHALARSYFDYANFPKIRRTECPCCATPTGEPDEALDRCEYPILVYTCPVCTLIYLVDILTPAGYGVLYAGNPSPYRQIAWRFASVDPFDPKLYKVCTKVNVDRYTKSLRSFLGTQRTYQRQLLDIGGSDGSVGAALGAYTTVLDVAGDEIRPSDKGTVGSIEAWAPTGIYSGILVCRTLDHFWEPQVALRKLRQVIEPNGWLFIDYSSQNVRKIDHTAYWNEKSLHTLLNRTGWRVEPGEFTRWYTRGVLCVPY